MTANKTLSKIGPFAILVFIYFIVGFLTTVNGQCQGPLKVAFLSDVGDLRNSLTTMISFFFFLGYLLNSPLAGKWIDKSGYKVTLLRSLLVMIAGLLFYFGSAWYASKFGNTGFSIGNVGIPYGYVLFLVGSFLMGTAAAMLQVVINPYIAAYDLPGTQPVQRMNINTAINSIGTTVAPFFVTGVMFAGVALENVTAPQLMIPFLALAICMIIVTVITSRLPLPDLQNTRSEEKLERSVWSFRHLTFGVIAIFFYVGTEVGIGSNINLYAMETGDNGALLATIYWGGFLVGRSVSSFFADISPKKMLIATTLTAILLLIVAIMSQNLYVMASVGLVHSVMWSCIFVLAVKGLGKYTSRASGVFMMGVFGGAVFPVLQGVLADALGSWRFTWIIAIVCEAVMLLYALWGSKVRETVDI